jgi:hypothetical protein
VQITRLSAYLYFFLTLRLLYKTLFAFAPKKAGSRSASMREIKKMWFIYLKIAVIQVLAVLRKSDQQKSLQKQAK